MLAPEIHPVLNAAELAEIAEFRDKLAYKTTRRREQMFYRWASSGRLTQRQHTLLCRYLYQGF